MITSIDDRRVKNFIDKNSDDPYFLKWQDLPWSQQIIFILKEIVNENLGLKRQIRELKGVKVNVSEQESTEEITEEPEDILESLDDMPQEEPIPTEEPNEIIEPIIEEEKLPVEISAFVCEKCGKKFANKGLLSSHMTRMHGEEGDEIAT